MLLFNKKISLLYFYNLSLKAFLDGIFLFFFFLLCFDRCGYKTGLRAVCSLEISTNGEEAACRDAYSGLGTEIING